MYTFATGENAMNTTTAEATKTVKLKTTPACQGRLTLAHPNAQPGKRPGVIVYAIEGVPADVADADVPRRADGTCFLKWLYQDENRPEAYVYQWGQLGSGKIIKQ
jgi:hypothetical protein